MSQNLDLYTVLGVGCTASAAEITHAYRTRLRALHPDTRVVSPEADGLADAQLWQLLRAYAVLRDPRRRADYDRTSGHGRMSGFGTPGSSPPHSAGPAGPVRIPVRHADKQSQTAPTQRPPVRAGPVRKDGRRIRVPVHFR